MSSNEAINKVSGAGEQKDQSTSLIRKLMAGSQQNFQMMIGLLSMNNNQQVDPGKALTDNMTDPLGNNQNNSTPLV